MRTELWDQFDSLVAGPSRYLATVHAHNADGTSGVTTYDGAEIRVQGQLGTAPPYNAWVQDVRVVEAGPNLPLVTNTV